VRLGRFVLVFLVAFAACEVATPNPDDVIIVCDAATPVCPTNLVCVQAIGRCLDPESVCLTRDGDAFVAADDGLVCGSADRLSTCFAGVCVPAVCGDGRIDTAVGEVCDDGAANSDAYSVQPTCKTDCSGSGPSCGDGVISNGEVCDDASRDECGSCNADCSGAGAGAVCGDGVVCPELEACDDAGESEGCNEDCTAARCGDGIVNSAAGEVCDDAGANSDAHSAEPHCNARCTGLGPFCGDSVKDDVEACDTAGQSATCEASCAVPSCGDGVQNVFVGESCDDGAASRHCTASCQPNATIDVGARHACAIDVTGAVRCFGENRFGQCGAENPLVVGDPLATMGGTLKPLALPAPATSVSVGLSTTCALLNDGRVACVGDNTRGAVGSGTPVVDVGGAAVRLVSGADHACVVRGDGRVVCWGDNARCQLGAGHARPTVGTTAADMGAALVPVDLGDERAVDVFAGAAFSCALLESGGVVCWGDNSHGQLGLGDGLVRGCAPGSLAQTPLSTPVATMALGALTACVLLRSGGVACWGDNASGVLGQGRDPSLPRGLVPLELGVFLPLTPLGRVPIVRLAHRGGDAHMCAVRADESAVCWGRNDNGQLGLEDDVDRGTSLTNLGDNLGAMRVVGDVVGVAGGGARTCAEVGDGRMFCLGDHRAGDSVAGLGRPRATPLGDTPGELGAALPEVPLSAACGNGILDNGEVCDDGFIDACGSCNATCSGVGAGAACGDNTICPEFEACEPLDGRCTDDCRVCASGTCDAICVANVCGDGVVCEGIELCDVASPFGDTCVAGCGSVNPSVAVGRTGTCLHARDGTVRCFGSPALEQLGVPSSFPIGAAPGDLSNLLTPVHFGSARHAVHIVKSGLGDFACAGLSDGTTRCWGDNRRGQHAVGDTITRGAELARMGDALPAADLGSGFVVERLSLGAQHVCAVSVSGRVKCWGDNTHGQLNLGGGGAVGGRPELVGDAVPTITVGALVDDVAAGGRHSCALTVDGVVVCWGDSSKGQVHPRGAGILDARDPVRLSHPLGANPPPRRAVGIAAGAETNCAIVEPVVPADSNVVCWGSNAFGVIGIGREPVANDVSIGDDFAEVTIREPVGLDAAAVDVCIGVDYACALKANGTVRCWGDGRRGQLGHADLVDNAVGDEPGEVAAHPDVPLAAAADAISCGAAAACAQLVDGRVSCWGDNTDGALGLERPDPIVASVGRAVLPTLPLP